MLSYILALFGPVPWPPRWALLPASVEVIRDPELDALFERATAEVERSRRILATGVEQKPMSTRPA